MFNLTANDLQQLKGGGGERFAHFVDRLIRAEAFCHGLAQSEIETQLRVNIPDGGVDTQVKQPIPHAPSGWFSKPTCWQFKSVDAKEFNDKVYKKKRNDLQEEIHKPYAEQLIKQGYAYCFCLLGDLPPSKVADWEAQLKAEADQLNPTAPPPRVIHGGQLVHWAERFPAVIFWLRQFGHGVFHWDAWRDTCRAVTPDYVPNPDWNTARQQIVQHVTFNAQPVGGDPCLTVGGAAGVGKTRLVFETLNESMASPGLVVYAADEQEAKSIATAIANTPHQTAILVADECTPPVRHFLNENLRGHVQRLRVVCLDNTGERLAALPSQIWLSADSLKNTDAILDANFPAVPIDRRHQYAQLSRGFVRLAADMCLHDHELKTGEMSGLLGSIERYVRHRLRGEDLPLISLLALFHKVGFREEVESEVASLCELAHRSAQQFRDAVRIVRESPGFVVQAGRYWYVTPEIVARVLFAEGWQRWVGDDASKFLESIPEQLGQQLIDRASKLGGEEVRAQLASFFRQRFDDLTAKDLSDPHLTSLAAAIVELSPEEYLPQLRSVIETAEADDLLQIRGDGVGRRWGPRRTLVWLLERLVSFPEFFQDCEACLFLLAVHETEPQVGNSATAIWKDLFKVYLSGTATPFDARIEVLRRRTASPNQEEEQLAFQGVSVVLERTTSRAVGSPVVAGRLRSSDWRPNSTEDEIDCYRAALSLCEMHLKGKNERRRRLAFGVLVSSTPFLLDHGMLDDLSRVLVPDCLSESEVRNLMNVVDHFLEMKEATRRADAYTERVRGWIERFRPDNFDGRLRSLCSRQPWDRRFSSDPKNERDETDELAAEVLAEPTRLEAHLDWLTRPEATAAERLGFALGRADLRFRCSGMISEHAIQHGSPQLLRGYVRCLVFSGLRPPASLLESISRLETAHPAIAVDILSYAGDSFDALNRILRLVESDAVAPMYLASLAFGIGRRKLTADELDRILPYFIRAAISGDAQSVQAGVRFLATYLQLEKREKKPSCIELEYTRSLAWQLVEASVPHVEGNDAFEWIEIARELAMHDPARATQLMAHALLSDNAAIVRPAQETLTELALDYPQAVIEGLGASLLDAENGWRLQVGELRDVVQQIPSQMIMNWIRQHGLNAARAIARHLPRPYVDESGRGVVPQVLNAVLREFDDDLVYDNFVWGARSGEIWMGNASERFRREANDTRQFLNHPNRRIREWAKDEIAYRRDLADREAVKHAERFLPS